MKPETPSQARAARCGVPNPFHGGSLPRRRLPGRWLAIAWVSAGAAGAATLIEDFSYPDSVAAGNGSVAGGWGSAWGTGANAASARVRMGNDFNLTYSGGGYAIGQTGTGRFYGNFGGTSASGPFRSTNRSIATPLTGTIWFSYLVQGTDLTGTDPENVSMNGVQFNKNLVSGNNYASSPFRIELANERFQVAYNGVTTTMAGTYAHGTTHLVLGRWDIGAGNDTLSVWFNPSNLESLGAPVFTAATADVGESLSSVGVFGWGTTYNLGDVNRTGFGSVDALRISNDAGAYAAVTGVPEPSVTMIALPLVACVFFRRR